MTRDAKRLAIIGGGAAGLAAAVAAGERARDLGVALETTVHERDDRVGRTILATGNGRCNFSNAHPYVDDYYNAEFAERVFHSLLFSVGSARSGASERDWKIICDCGSPAHAFFYRHGLMWREEDDGRQYPSTNKASTVVDVLRASAAAVGVREACGREVVDVNRPQDPGKPFTLRFADGALERADAVVVACGGRACASFEAAGLAVLRPRPVLGPLRVADSHVPIVRELDNIRVRCVVSLMRPERDGSLREIASERGELMFRKYGVSGICVYNLSRFAWPGDVLQVNFLNGDDVAGAKDYLFRRRKLLASTFGAGVTYGDMLRGLLLPRVADAVCKRMGRHAGDAFAKADVPVLAESLVAFPLEVAGIGDADLCQVRRGGFDVEQFNPATMAARDLPGLFAAGEALDVDGPCGGYNLHWAWSSGLLAGRSAVDWLSPPPASAPAAV